MTHVHQRNITCLNANRSIYVFCVCSNAIKFTHEGNVTISVRVVPPPPPSIERAAKNVFHAATGISATALSHLAPSTGTLPGSPIPSSSLMASHHEASETAVNLNSTGNNLHPSSVQSTPDREEPAVDEGVEDTVWLLCEVSDSGIGIPGELIQEHQLLMRFYTDEYMFDKITMKALYKFGYVLLKLKLFPSSQELS